MKTIPLDQIIELLLKQKQAMFASKDSVAVHDAIYRAIAAGQPVAPEHVAQATGIPVDDIRPAFDDLRRGGCDVDAQGNLIGFMLSLSPTQHKFKLNGRDLYTWCAFDAVFLPGFLNQAAYVESTCPATGDTIHLTISPQGIERSDPADAVLSLPIPGISAACAPGQKGGADGPSCNASNFFVNRQTAQEWLGPETDLSILSLNEAWHVAYHARIDPYTTTLASLNLEQVTGG